mgnify:CR=1 FL=1
MSCEFIANDKLDTGHDLAAISAWGRGGGYSLSMMVLSRTYDIIVIHRHRLYDRGVNKCLARS